MPLISNKLGGENLLNKKLILIISIIIITSFIIVGCGSNPISDNSNNNGSNLAVNKTLNITVTDEDTQDLLSDVNLTIQTEEGEITGTTDSNGVYSVESKFIEGDNYNVTANKDGYEQKTVSLNITDNSDNITLDITLNSNVAVVSNDSEMEAAFQDSNITTIILAYNITIDGQGGFVAPRDLTIDGDNQYKITGPGYIRIRPEGGNHDITFKNLTFDPSDDITKWYEETDPVEPSRYYYFMTAHDTNNNGYVVNITFDNCFVNSVDTQGVQGTFFFDTTGADLTVINSDINIEANLAFSMNRGGRSIIRNNDFNQTGSVLHSNNMFETSIDIENNNFENLPNIMSTMFLNTTFNDNNPITVNGNDLRPLYGTVSKEDFEDDALLIHQSIADMNTVASDYLTSYFDDDNSDGYLFYEGNNTNPWYP